MSWAEEDWTVGLSGRVLQKVKELQVHQERLSRENKQKQLQLDNIHTSLEKQTAKYDEVRGELQSVHRELQSARDEAKAATTSRERLSQELQTKQAQVCSFEGQLEAARSLNNKLTQEVKRLEAELEKLQNSSRSADTTPFSTPCWSTASPWEHSGSRKEERPGHRDAGQGWASNSRQRLQFSEVATDSLPRQQYKNTPHRHPSDQSDLFSTPSAAFPWERDDSRPAAKRRSPPSPQTPCADVISQVQSDQGGCGKEKDQRTETDISSALRTRVSALEEELSAKAGMLKSIQNEMVQNKKELAARELSVQRARDELGLAHTRMAQESERASGAEQRLKQLQEELKCQRQNAESSRLQHQQRSKELEKQHQRDLTELQKERQCLEKQHQQEVNKLNLELQQARTLHNALQAQADKLSLQKQALDKELDTLREKLKWTEGQLQESQKKEAQTQAKLTEAVREAEGVAVCLEQSRKKERALEEEGRRLAEEQADALRLLKELQEQKAAPELVPQPLPFCPVGQSFSTQPTYSFHSRPSSNIKRPSAAAVAEQRKEENGDRRRAEISASYPSDREPGEGIDSEHITVVISTDSKCLGRGGHRKNSKEENKSGNEEMESDSSATSKLSSFDRVLSCSSPCATGSHTITPGGGDRCSSGLSAEDTPPMSEQAKALEEVKRENALLRSELHDTREELQKRLEDLEGQRRAEAEARTRLKQLSRKKASQSVEQEEQEKEWRAQLESAKAETERLRKAMVALEAEAKGGRKERENLEREEQEEEKNRALQDRESEMIELNIQLKKQLAEVKAQLTLEREERTREEEERNQITNADTDVKKELSMKLEELQAELEELKRGGKEDSPEEENLTAGNSPLTYLTLRDDELNSNMVRCDNKPLPSPEQHLLFCQSANERNTLVSQATADLIQGERTVIDAEHSPLSDEEQTSHVTSDLEDARQNNLVGASLSLKSLADSRRDEPASAHLAKEVERLCRENAKETERANQCQVKLEALQSQVTRQTQQLSTAFEKQSQHISGLLTELQEKESALLSQGEELQRYKQELDALKSQKEGQEMAVKNVGDGKQKDEEEEKSVEISGLQPNQDTFLPTNSPAECDSNTQRVEGRPEIVTSGAERAAPSQRLTADTVVELLALRQENQQLKQRIEGLTFSDTSNQTSHTDGEDREDPVTQRQNSGNATPSRRAEQSTPTIPNDITSEARQAPLRDVTSQDEGGELEREDKRTTRTEEEQEAVCQLHMKRLQQQVVELRMKVHALSEETQQQAEELAVWRLASQPAPTFSDNQSEAQEKLCAVRLSQPNPQPTDETDRSLTAAPHPGAQESTGHMTLVREDELFLSSSSNKLQGRMLFSRLQHSNLPESKSLHPSKKTSALHEYNQDSPNIDKDSEKENQDINLLHQSNIAQKQKKDTDVIQVIPEKTGQQDVPKDLHKVSGPKQSRTAEGLVGNPQAKPDASREIITTSDSSVRDVRAEMKSVSSQTEESLSLRDASVASELRCAYTQTEEEEEREEKEEEEEEEVVESPPVSPVPMSEGAAFGDKMLFSGSFPIPADPARLAERIRRNRTQLSAAFDDTEYEPYGLPEVVMKGFADIPSGPSCPYIVRRGLLGTTVVPAPPKTQEQVEETD